MTNISKRPISLEGLVSAYVTDTGITRVAFAAMIGCSWRTLKNKIRGTSPLLFNEAEALSKTLGIPLDELRVLLK